MEPNSSAGAADGGSMLRLYHEPNCERERQLNEYYQPKEGVIGLVQSGITKIPEFFILPAEHQAKKTSSDGTPRFQVPVIDLQGGRGSVVEEIYQASRTWGLFYLVNHGVPLDAMNKILLDARQFYEQPAETRVKFFSLDQGKNLKYYPGISLALKTALWKETLVCDFDHDDDDDDDGAAAAACNPEWPPICSQATNDYVAHMTGLRDKLARLFSEALGLSSDHLEQINWMHGKYKIIRSLLSSLSRASSDYRNTQALGSFLHDCSVSQRSGRTPSSAPRPMDKHAIN